MHYNILSDQELAALLKAGDHVAYTEIYHRFKGVLYVHAYNKLRNTEEAKDIIQDLFINLWTNHETLLITGNLSSYLYTAVRNRVFRTISRKSLASDYVTSIQQSVTEGNCMTDHRVRESLLQALIEKEINALPEKMREVFLLSRKANLSHKEIAEQLGITEATVKKQVNNALKILKKKITLLYFLLYLIK